MGEVNTYAATVSAAIEEQSSTTAEIARNMNEAAMGVKDIVSNVTGVPESAAENSKKSTETKDAADTLTNLAAQLAELVSKFQTGGGEYGGSAQLLANAGNGGASNLSQLEILAGTLASGGKSKDIEVLEAVADSKDLTMVPANLRGNGSAGSKADSQ